MLAERKRESVTQFAQRRPSANFANDYDHNDLFDNHDDHDYDDPSDNCDHQNHSHHESSQSISLHNGPSTNFAI